VEERVDVDYPLGYALAVADGMDVVDFKFTGVQGAFMNSHDVKDHGASDLIVGQAKKPWVTPSLQIIALKSAEAGTHASRTDGPGGHFNRPRS
jgi:hypothetical protein